VGEWRAVPGWEGLYEVSDEGQVRSLARSLSRVSKGRTQIVHLKERLLTPTPKGNGYVTVALRDRRRDDGNHYVHRLVCEAFRGPPPADCEVAHFDGDRMNNEASNLPRLENARDKQRQGVQLKGEEMWNARLTEDQVILAITAKKGIRALARKFGVNPSTLSCARSGRSWRYLREEANNFRP
jgi:NUMOD4 motif-containing protein/HNH endonuclease